MSEAPPAPLTVVLKNPGLHLGGTDLRLHLSLGRSLINEVLAARPDDTPIDELYLDPDPGNHLKVHLLATAPVIGGVRRVLTLEPGPAVSFPDQPWLQLRIVDGFKFLDKPLIKLMQGQIESRLPKGIELTTKYLRIHVPAMLTNAGYQELVPLVRHLQLIAEDNRLVIDLRLKP